MLDHPVQLVVAAFTGLLGFGGIVGSGADIARVLFAASVVLLALSVRRDRKRRVPNPRLQAWRQPRSTRN